MTKPTMEEYVNKTRGDYYSGITKTMINGKAAYELKGNFLDDLLDVFPISLTGDASKWLINEPQISMTTWGDLTELFFRKYYPPSRNGKIKKGDDQEVLTGEAFSNLEETYDDGEQEIAKIFRIETNLFDFKTPLCKAFIEFNYLFKIDTDLFTNDIPGFMTYNEFTNEWMDE
nr:VIER F-box protein 2 [Tanacetum cinerariifolium]